eukprot:scaffold34_cov124-Isochrysis_galbana.AAC.14
MGLARGTEPRAHETGRRCERWYRCVAARPLYTPATRKAIKGWQPRVCSRRTTRTRHPPHSPPRTLLGSVDEQVVERRRKVAVHCASRAQAHADGREERSVPATHPQIGGGQVCKLGRRVGHAHARRHDDATRELGDAGADDCQTGP